MKSQLHKNAKYVNFQEERVKKICLSNFRCWVDFYISLRAVCVLSSLMKFKPSVGFATVHCLMGAALWQTFFHLCQKQMKTWFLSLDSMCSVWLCSRGESVLCRDSAASPGFQLHFWMWDWAWLTRGYPLPNAFKNIPQCLDHAKLTLWLYIES